MRHAVLTALTTLLAMGVVGCSDKPPRDFSQFSNAPVTDAEAKRLLSQLEQVDALAMEIDESAPFLHRESEEPLTADEKAKLGGLWAPLVDHTITLGGMKKQFRNPAFNNTDANRSLVVVFAALAAELDLTVAMVGRTTGNGVFTTWLDEAHPEYGLSAGMGTRLQTFLLDSRALDNLGDLERKVRETFPAATNTVPTDDVFINLARHGMGDAQKVRRIMEKRGLSLRVTVFLEGLEDTAADVALPVITKVATWMGDTLYYRRGTSLISAEQVEALTAKLQPGDVILERRNWYVSNVGLPGFWPHSELFLGKPATLAAAFDGDGTVLAHFGKTLSAQLADAHPDAWRTYNSATDDGETRVILEAISDGVHLSSATEAMAADYVAGLRPRMSALDKAKAIDRAFGGWGKPYDFWFDFETDASLVCSELVYKSYAQPAADGPSLTVALESVLGRTTLPPSNFAQRFDEQYGQESADFDFVVFMEGNETNSNAAEASVETFRASWQRSKWDLEQD